MGKGQSKLTDVQHNAKIMSDITISRRLIAVQNANIARYNREIEALYKKLRPIPNAITPSQQQAQPQQTSWFAYQNALSQLAYYKKALGTANTDITALQTSAQLTFNELQLLKDADAVLKEMAASLQKEIDAAVLLYNQTKQSLNDANDKINKMEFKQDVSDTLAMITDLNQPYVKHGDDLVAMLSKHIPITNADATYQKIEYREIEYAKLKSINTIINIVYYIGVIFLFVLLFASNNVFLKERFIFYLFLLLFPFLYPWIYMYIIQIWTYLFPTKLFSGPTNAFIDQTNQPNVYYN